MPEFGLAGAETMCEALTYALTERGHEVAVVSLYDYHSAITERMERRGIRVVYLGKRRGPDLAVLGRLRREVRAFRPDVLHTHLYLLKYVALSAAGLPVRGIVHTVHNVAQRENDALDRAVNRLLFRTRRALPVALSPLVRDTIVDVYRLPAERVPVVLNGISLSRCTARESYAFGPCIRIAHVGRYMAVKNHRALCEAVARLHAADPRLELHLYGDGPLRADIRNLIAELHAADYIIDHGLVSDACPPLAEADLFVLPSLYEGIPMTIIEAMGTALPIVASAVGGIPDMLADGREGLLCQPTAESIADALRRFIGDEALRRQCGTAARRRADDFSAATMARQYELIYQSL